MTSGHNVVYLNASRTGAASLKTLAALQDLAIERLERVLRAALDRVDDELFSRAARAGTNADQERYFVAMRQVRLQRRRIEIGFAQGLHDHFAALTNTAECPGQARETAPQDTGLELMDEARVEQDVAAETAIGKTRARCALLLAQLATRLDSLVNERLVDEDSNPLDPRQIVAAFSQSLESLDIDIQPRIVLYKLFEQQLLAELPAVYEAGNRVLSEAGVLPGLKGATAPTKPELPAAGASAAGEPTAGADEAQDEAQAQAALEVLQRLVARSKYGDQEATPPASATGNAVRLPDVVAALSSLQPRALPASNAEPLDAAALKRYLGDALNRRGHSAALDRSADDTIDIVSMLFDAILEDPRLPSAIKALLARLQIPALKVALLDRAFFASRRHPARQLINELARAALGWTEPRALEKDPLYQEMTAVVEQIVRDFDDDVGVFEAALRSFRRFVEQERVRAETIEQRARQAAEGQAKVEEARERVQREIAARVRGGALPEVVQRLLEDAWYKVLCIVAIKEGTESVAWSQKIAIMDRLVWSVQPKADANARQRMLAQMPALLNDLREGLNAILFNPSEMTRLFRELEAEHLRCLAAPPKNDDSHAAPASSAEALDMAPPAELGSDSGDTVSTPLVDDAMTQRLREVELGTWFELYDEQGNALRAKLSARLNGARRFIFVNRAGFKLADRPLERLAADLRERRAVILDDDSLFDRALESVIGNLRELRAGQGL